MQCDKILKTYGGTTGGLLRHLEKHKINLKSKTDAKASSELSLIHTTSGTTEHSTASNSQSATPTPLMHKKKKIKITHYFIDPEENSLEATLSHMTSRDGLAFSLFCTSADIHKGLIARGFTNLPKSPNTIRTVVIDYSKKVCQVVINEMQQDMASGKKFSLTFDEWTSVANKRYMSINVHSVGGKVWCLGLVRVCGSMPADRCVQLVEEKLKENNLSLQKDIVGVTTDGASIMTKVGKSIAPFQQLCYEHGVQLGILDVLYKKNSRVCTDEYASVAVCEMELATESDRDSRQSHHIENLAVPVAHAAPVSHETVSVSEPEITELAMDVEEVDETGGVTFLQYDSGDGETGTGNLHLEIFPELVENIDCLIRKVRKVVCMFKNSPTRNDCLQKHVRDDFGKTLPLLLDTRTRWSSLFTMLERFYMIRNAVSKAVIDLKLQTYVVLTDDELEQIRNIVQVLQVVKLTVEALCRRDATLLTADAALKFMLKKLRAEQTMLGSDLANALSRRISQRRNKLTGVLTYLHNPNALDSDYDEDSDLFAMPSAAEI